MFTSNLVCFIHNCIGLIVLKCRFFYHLFIIVGQFVVVIPKILKFSLLNIYLFESEVVIVYSHSLGIVKFSIKSLLKNFSMWNVPGVRKSFNLLICLGKIVYKSFRNRESKNVYELFVLFVCQWFVCSQSVSVLQWVNSLTQHLIWLLLCKLS